MSRKIDEKELEAVSGGLSKGSWATVCGVQTGYLAIRSAPAYDYNNEINHVGLHNNDRVQITGSYVQGTGFNGVRATYVWVFVPKFGISGYVDSAYIR